MHFTLFTSFYFLVDYKVSQNVHAMSLSHEHMHIKKTTQSIHLCTATLVVDFLFASHVSVAKLHELHIKSLKILVLRYYRNI